MEEIGIKIMEFIIAHAPWLAPIIIAVPFMACIPCWIVGLPLIGGVFSWVLAKLGISIACKIRKKK